MTIQYKCGYCGSIFPVKTSCQGHLSSHTKKGIPKPEIIEVENPDPKGLDY